MGRYFAIIRDAYREAKASRMLFLLLSLSTLVIIASLMVGWWKTETYNVVLGDNAGKPKLGMSIKKNDPHGAAIQYVSMNGPSQDIGLAFGAYLVRMNDTSIGSKDDVANFMKSAKPGQKVKLVVQKPSLSILGYNSENEIYREVAAIPTPAKIGIIVGILQQWVLGLGGLLIALIITAGSMPKFLETGSLHLVMSRPVSRFGVIFARYLGGLSFIVLLSIYLLGGVLLSLQMRSGIWVPSAFWSIPILIFLFAQFYAFSVLISIVTRNQIMTVIGACVFYCAALIINVANFSLDTVCMLANGHAIQFVADGQRLNIETLNLSSRRQGPPTDYQLKQLVVGASENSDASDFVKRRKSHKSVGNLALSNNNLVLVADQSITLVNSYNTNQRERTDLRVRGKPRHLAVSEDGQFVVVSTSSDLACYDLFDKKRLPWPEPTELSAGINSASMIDGEKEPQFLASALAFHNRLAIIGLENGKVRVVTIAAGADKYVLETNFSEPVVGLATMQSTLIAVSKSGKVATFDTSDFTKKPTSSKLALSNVTQFKSNAHNQLFVVSNDHGRVLLYKASNGSCQFDKELYGASGKLLGVAISESGDRIAASDSRAQVLVWNSDSGDVIETKSLAGAFGNFRTVFNYTALLFPRTKKLDLLTDHLMSDEFEDLNLTDLQKEARKVNPAMLVLNAGLFIFIVLGIGSMIFYSRDL